MADRGDKGGRGPEGDGGVEAFVETICGMSVVRGDEIIEFGGLPCSPKNDFRSMSHANLAMRVSLKGQL